MTIKEIRADKEIARAFIKYFVDELEQYDEFLIGNVSKSLHMILLHEYVMLSKF